MLSREEIEKAKKKLNKPKKYDLIEIIRIFKRNGIKNYCVTDNKTIQTFLQYIQELETSNAELDKENNRLEKIEFERDMLKKGQASLMSSRKKWKDRYYKEKGKFNKVNKIIDEMAKAYMKVTSEKYRIKNICEKGKCQNEECHEDDWTGCIKQYFEKKVEEK